MNILSVTQFTDSWFHPNYKEFKQSVEHLSFINYNITNCEFAYNNYGSLLVEHNPIEYSNNIWSYHIINNKFIENGLVNNEINMVHLFPFSLSSSSSAFRMSKTFQHGLQFYLPFISNELNWRYESDIINHQISLLHNQFNFNKNFHVQISGYTAKLNIENNQFLENYCQNVLPGEKQIPENGLVQSYGMEREIILSENYFLRNKNCSYIIQLKGESQSRDLVMLQSFMKKNILQDNEICMNSEKRFQFVNPWECYTMGVFGTQNITIRHNSFENCKVS